MLNAAIILLRLYAQQDTSRTIRSFAIFLIYTVPHLLNRRVVSSGCDQRLEHEAKASTLLPLTERKQKISKNVWRPASRPI